MKTPLDEVLHRPIDDTRPPGRPIYSDGPVIHAIDLALARLQTHLTYWGLVALTGLVIVAVAVSLTAASALHTSNFVQQQRRVAIFQNCQAQNQRHDNTINELNKIAAIYIKQHPSQAKMVTQSIGQNVLLINALQPKQDCRALANQQAGNHVTGNTVTTRTASHG